MLRSIRTSVHKSGSFHQSAIPDFVQHPRQGWANDLAPNATFARLIDWREGTLILDWANVALGPEPNVKFSLEGPKKQRLTHRFFAGAKSSFVTGPLH